MITKLEKNSTSSEEKQKLLGTLEGKVMKLQSSLQALRDQQASGVIPADVETQSQIGRHAGGSNVWSIDGAGGRRGGRIAGGRIGGRGRGRFNSFAVKNKTFDNRTKTITVDYNGSDDFESNAQSHFERYTN
jgi:hypothetical protein